MCKKLTTNSTLNTVHAELMAVQTELVYHVVSGNIYLFTKNLHFLYIVVDVRVYKVITA
jgi:hypothetical protein